MKFLVVENRNNTVTKMCLECALAAGVDIEQIAVTESTGEYLKFCEIYKHYSSNSKEFEMICFRRYFLLSQYASLNGIKSFVLIDSDVLLFRGIEKHINDKKNNYGFIGSAIKHEFELLDQISPHVSYWNTSQLNDFIDYLIQGYQDVKFTDRLMQIQNSFLSKGVRGGVSDMTLLALWSKSKENNDEFINECNNDGVIDHNISLSSNFYKNEFLTTLGAKKIVYKNGVPFFQKINGDLVRVFAMHFQGRAKIFMPHVHRMNQRMEILARLVVLVSRNVKNYVYGLKTKKNN